jgi:hypothetical protein
MCVFRFSCPTLHCHLWPVWLYHVFPHYLINGTIFGGKKLLNIKCVFRFSLQLLPKTFPILRRIERDIANVQVSDFNENWVSSTDFQKKNSNIKFHEKQSSGSRVVSWGQRDRQTDRQTDRRDGANSRFLRFCERTEERGGLIETEWRS